MRRRHLRSVPEMDRIQAMPEFWVPHGGASMRPALIQCRKIGDRVHGEVSCLASIRPALISAGNVVRSVGTRVWRDCTELQ